MATTITTGIDFDLELQAIGNNGVLIDLSSADILQYGAALYQADGTLIAKYSTNGTTLGGTWQVDSMIEAIDLPNGVFKVHVNKEMTQGLISQDVTARIMIQSVDADDDFHVDNEIWNAGEDVAFVLEAAIDDSIITMT